MAAHLLLYCRPALNALDTRGNIIESVFQIIHCTGQRPKVNQRGNIDLMPDSGGRFLSAYSHRKRYFNYAKVAGRVSTSLHALNNCTSFLHSVPLPLGVVDRSDFMAGWMMIEARAEGREGTKIDQGAQWG